MLDLHAAEQIFHLKALFDRIIIDRGKPVWRCILVKLICIGNVDTICVSGDVRGYIFQDDAVLAGSSECDGEILGRKKRVISRNDPNNIRAHAQ
jgi:hypothetical protein